MKKITTLATALALSLAAPGLASAMTHHHEDDAPAAATDGAGPQGGRADMMNMMNMMMPMMMKMHRQMMGGGMHGGAPGSGHGKGMAGMDGSTMRMMMGGGMMGGGMMGGLEPGAAMKAMQDRLTEFDADGDGMLSLAEFETLHAAMIREKTVDHFQHLDADGDGRVTKEEMTAPAHRMQMRMKKQSEN